MLLSIPWPFGKNIHNSTFYLSDVILGILSIGWILHFLFKPSQRPIGLKVFYFFIPLLGAGILSGVNAKDFYRYLGYLYLWLQIPLAYLICIKVIDNRKRLAIIVFTIFLGTVIYSIPYITERFLFHLKNLRNIRVQYLHGHSNPNLLVPFFGLTLIIMIGILPTFSKLPIKTLLFIFIGICLSGLLATASRWGILSCMLILLAQVVCLRNQMRDSNKNTMLYLLIVLLFLPTVLFIIWTILLSGSFFIKPFKLFNLRLLVYQKALTLFKDHPFIGIGMGNFRTAMGFKNKLFIHPHSIYIEVLIECGILGLAGLFFLFINLTRHFLSMIKHIHSNNKYMLWGGFWAVIFFFVNNIFDFTLGHGNGILLGVIIALCDTAYRLEYPSTSL
jgi:O-antigen ligase